MSNAPTTPKHGDFFVDNTKMMPDRVFDGPTGEWVNIHEFEWREHKRRERNEICSRKSQVF